MASLTNSLQEKETAQKLLNSYNNHKENSLYRSVMEIISKNNRTLFEEEGNTCQTLEDILDKKLPEKMPLYKNGLIPSH